MKILLIHHCNERGGGSKSFIDIWEMLGNEDTLVVTNKKADGEQFIENQVGKYITYDDEIGTISWYSGGPKFISRTFFKSIFKIIKFKKFLKKIIEEYDPDVIMVNSIVLAWIGALRNNKKKICFVRETKKRGVISELQSFLLDKFNKVVFITEFDSKSFNIIENKKSILYDCVKKEKFEKKDYKKNEVNSEKFNVLYVGGESKLKGWNILEKMFVKSEILNNKNINFIILGCVSEENKIKHKNIKYLGSIDNVQDIYRISKLVILPSTQPHQLRPIFEAGIAKVPVITSKFKQIEEHMNGKNIRCIQANNYLMLEKEIIYLYNNPRVRKQLSEENYKFVLEKYEFEIIKKKLIAMLREFEE